MRRVFSSASAKTLSFTSCRLTPMENPSPEPFRVQRGGVAIAGETLGEGPDVVLLHGLTATRCYVLMVTKALARAWYRVTLYDARGHGVSSPAAERSEYGDRDLGEDLEAVREHPGAEPAVAGGAPTVA